MYLGPASGERLLDLGLIGALARTATRGIYLVRDVPLELQRAARARAVTEGTSLRWVLLQALRDYAAGRWTPRGDATLRP